MAVSGPGGAAGPPPPGSPSCSEALAPANPLDAATAVAACYDLRGALTRTLRSIDKQRAGMAKLGAWHTLSSARNLRRFIALGEAASIYPGLQNLLLTARALGLAATLTTWHAMFEQEFKAILGIPGHVNTYAVIPVGWPKGNFGAVSRRPVAESIHWQRW